MDEVTVMDAAETVSAEFVELEIELREGDPAALDLIVKELERAGAKASDQTPKLFRVLSLPPRPSGKTPFESLRRLLQEQLDQMFAHDPGTRLGTDPESLHDMRVAVRRSRALLRAGNGLVATDTRTLSLELKWLGSVLGDVRDLDVLAAHLHDEVATLDTGDRAAAGPLLDALEGQRTSARLALLEALDGQRYDALLDSFQHVLTTLDPSSRKGALDRLARRELEKLRRDVHALDRKPADDVLHALRKRGKRVRYAYELSGAKSVVKRAKGFQDVLGEHQDSVVAEEHLRALSNDAPADQALAAGLLIQHERARRAKARASWRKAWRALERAAK